MDCSPTRFYIPLHALKDPVRIEQLAQIFKVPVCHLQVALGGDPVEAPQVGMGLTVLDAVPCWTFADPACPHGGVDQEEAMITAGIPFLRGNGRGIEYGPARTVYLGHGDPVDICTDKYGEPVVRVECIDGVPLVDSEGLQEIASYVAQRRKLLAGKDYTGA